MKKIYANMGAPTNAASQGADIRDQVRYAKLIDYVRQLEQRNRLLEQELVPNAGPQAMMQNLGASNLPQQMQPGNVDNITRAIWPFFFPTNYVEVLPNRNVRSSFTVTQEAAFIWLYCTKTVHKLVDGVPTYIDPSNYNTEQGQANGLKFTIRDAQSSREYNSLPVPLDHIGDPLAPWALPSPVLILPNSTMEVQFINQNPDETYYPSVSFFGYRIRLSDQEKTLSTVQG